MTTSQIITRDDQVLARFGQHEVPVPDSLGRILTGLIRGSPRQVWRLLRL